MVLVMKGRKHKLRWSGKGDGVCGVGEGGAVWKGGRSKRIK